MIQHVVAILNPEKLGFSVVAHTLVSLRSHTDEGNNQLHRFIATAPEILECYSQTGDADFLMKIVARDLDHLSMFLEPMIKTTGGLASVTSSIVLRTLKKSTELPYRLLVWSALKAGSACPSIQCCGAPLATFATLDRYLGPVDKVDSQISRSMFKTAFWEAVLARGDLTDMEWRIVEGAFAQRTRKEVQALAR